MSASVSFPFLCFDTEDDSPDLLAAGKSGFLKKITQIAAITARGKHYYNKGDATAFKKWLLQQPEKYCYALNIQYDLGSLFGRELDELDCTLVGSRMIKAVWGPKIFVDVYNLWFQSVKSLGDVFDLEKKEFNIHSKEYVFRDVEIIREAMLYVWRFAADLGIDEVPPTLGSLGVKLWRHWGGESVHESHEICRDAIFGGRVEIFKTCNDSLYQHLSPGNKPIKVADKVIPPLPQTIAYTDLNSLYPHCMTKAFPGQLEDTGKKFRELGIVHATVSVPKCDIAVLPYRDGDGKIYYPYGKFTGVWTAVELRAAVDNGAKIDKVHASYSTDEKIYPYKTYMERIYKIRLASKSKAEKELYKRLMNTLYGRTGSSGKIGRTVLQTANNRNSGVPYGSRVLTSYMMPLSEEVNWGHTAHITSYGRLELLKHLQLIGAEKLIYCDTDSTIFDCPDKNIPFPIATGLGAMKLESWESVAIPYAPKMYQLGDTYKAKGVPKKLQREYIEKGFAAYDMPFKFREAVAFYDRDNAKQLSVWRRIEKENRANYDKKIRKNNRYYPCKIIDV